MEQPLDHIRVLDLSRILAGPWAGQTLADLGAEVIKIERPERGDDTRAWGPPYAAAPDGGDTGESAYFLSANRGKKSVTVDISRTEGQEIVRTLAAGSDVLIENYKKGGLARYGLDYSSLRHINPRLIYCSITGFGQTGPYSGRAGYDFLIQAMGGLMSVTGEADGLPGGGPQKIGVALSDILTGLYTTVAALSALAWRDKTGRGQHVDMALLDVTIAAMANQAMNYLVSGSSPGRMGNAHPNVVPYQAYRAADDHIILAVGNDSQFRRFCAVAGQPELADDARFATNRDRVVNRDELARILIDLIARQPRSFWLEELERAGVPCGPINDLAQVFDDPHVRSREMRRDLPHATAGTVPAVSNPMRFSDSPVRYRHGPPTLGQHTEEVLRTLAGLDERKIAALRSAGIV